MHRVPAGRRLQLPMSYNVAEWTVESAALDWLRGLRWETAFGPDLAFDGPRPERVDYADVILAHRLQSALARINSEVPPAAFEQAVRAATRIESPSLIENNRRFHRLLADGVPVEYPGRGGRIVHARVGLLGLRRAGQQRLAGGEPVHGNRGKEESPA